MDLTLSTIKQLKIGSWEIFTELSQKSTLENIPSSVNLSASKFLLAQHKSIFPSQDKDIPLHIILAYPTTQDFSNQTSFLQAAWHWLKISYLNHTETYIDIIAGNTQTDFANIFAIIKLGKFTTVNLEKTSLTSHQLTAIVKGAQENNALQNLSLPNIATQTQRDDAETLTKRNRAKSYLSRWYTNPIKHLSVMGQAAIIALCLWAGISFSTTINILFPLYFLGDYIDKIREKKFYHGYNKIHHTIPVELSVNDKTAYQYGLNAGKSWLPGYAKACFELPTTTRSYDTYLAGVGEGIVAQEKHILAKK